MADSKSGAGKVGTSLGTSYCIRNRGSKINETMSKNTQASLKGTQLLILRVRKNDFSRLKHIAIKEILESKIIFEKGKAKKEKKNTLVFTI